MAQSLKGGQRVDIESHITLIRDARGEPASMLAINRDVTERNRAARQLEEQAFLLAHVSDAVVRYAIDSTITYWSVSAERLYGFSAEEALGSKSLELLQSEYRDPSLSRERVFAELEQHGELDIELRQRTKDGRLIEVESRTTLLRNEQGEPVGVLGISRDVTARKRAEEALRGSEERLRRALEIETVGVIFFRPDGSITATNDAFLRMSGYSRDEFAQGLVRWDNLTPAEWMPRTMRAIDELLALGALHPTRRSTSARMARAGGRSAPRRS